jgi:hypothetical protein
MFQSPDAHRSHLKAAHSFAMAASYRRAYLVTAMLDRYPSMTAYLTWVERHKQSGLHYAQVARLLTLDQKGE